MAGVDPVTIIHEVDQVDNGFVAIIGYQLQGYDVVRIPQVTILNIQGK
ncbi:MAG: hypothetical protein K0A94_02575 [Desulfuromonadales bacterium]|nr:hypothetical protein [Desulfuromonadales bacterium]